MTNNHTRAAVSRLRCVLLGCAADSLPECHYCHAGLYEDFVQSGRLEPLLRTYWRVRRALRRLGRKTCDQCGRKFWRGYDNELCSEECHDNWLPF